MEKKNKEEKASGIDTTEHTELDDLLLEIYELQKQSDTVAATAFENKTLKQNKERLEAEEVRQLSVKRLRARHEKENVTIQMIYDPPKSRDKRRSNGNDTIFLETKLSNTVIFSYFSQFKPRIIPVIKI